MQNEVIPCRVCNLQFKGHELYELHVNSKEHANVVVKISELPPSKPLIDPDDYFMNGQGMYFCKICNINVTGIVPWQQHLMGQQHLKKQRNRAALASFDKSQEINRKVDSPISGMAAVKNPMNINISVNRSGSSFSSPPKEKEATQTECDSISSKLESLNINDSYNSPSSLSASDKSMFPFKCDPCGKRFTGVESYQQHIASAQHLKKKEQAASLIPRAYYCELCGISLSGPIPYKQHIDSIKHAKKIIANNASPTFSPIRQTFDHLQTSTPKNYEEQLLLQRLMAPQSINVSLQIDGKNTSSEKLNIISADEPFTLPENKKKTKGENVNRETEVDGNSSDEDGVSYYTVKTEEEEEEDDLVEIVNELLREFTAPDYWHDI